MTETTAPVGFGHEAPYRGRTNEWYTPAYITDALGTFDLDPCTSPKARVIAPNRFTIEDDGLNKPWVGRVWLNPPYGELTDRWLKKMSEHNNGIVLIFARTETKMFQKYVWDNASAIFFFYSRIKFLNEGAEPMGSAGAPSVLIAYDNKDSSVNYDILKSCGLKGKFINLRG